MLTSRRFTVSQNRSGGCPRSSAQVSQFPNFNCWPCRRNVHHQLSAIFRASPSKRIVGRPPFSRTTSKSTHRTPRLQPVPKAFIAASFAANRPAYRSYLFRNLSQYSLSATVNTRRKNGSPCRSMAFCILPTSAKSTPMPIITESPIVAGLQTHAFLFLYFFLYFFLFFLA